MGRRPGRVFRVQAMVALVPATRSTHRRVAVAMPLMCCTRFRAVRSPFNRLLVGPSMVARMSPFSTRSPSFTLVSNRMEGSSRVNTRRPISSPAMTPLSLATQ